MIDKILIDDLTVRCIVGIRPEERRERQDVVINIVLWADLKQAGVSDNIQDTVDYSAIKKRVVADVEASKYHLIETLAENIAAICLDYSGIMRVQVNVAKPLALRFARSVAVEIVRERE